MPVNTNQTERISFNSVDTGVQSPDFLEIQINSFKNFLQLDTKPENRKDEGLFKTFGDNFPITDARNQFVLEFLDYFVNPPKYTIRECAERGLTYSVALKARLKLYCTDPEHEEFETIVQDVYLGNIPYITPRGTFVINGAERVVVSQLHRSPGVFFGQSLHASGGKIYSARVIPFKGSWIEFTTDVSKVMHAYIDRKKKLPVTTLFRAIGIESDKDILSIFDLAENQKVTKSNAKNLINKILVASVLKTWDEDFVDEETGEVFSLERTEIILERETVLTKEDIDTLLENDIKEILVQKESDQRDHIIYNTLQKDKTNTKKEAVTYIYRQLRNTEPPDEETANSVITKLFFSDQRYNLGNVGRYRMNKKLGLDIDMDMQVLTEEDILTIVKYLIELVNSKAEVDDIDHLSNRRVKTVGEQLSEQFSVGLARMSRTIKERMNVIDNEVFTPIDLINAKALTSVINSFFGTSQLSQFMDQTNPLAEVTHKRRLSALGPGGLSREHAGFEVRDVHYTHYGRMCPIETPEGPNIGLISSMAVYSRVNEMGFLETPYFEVNDGVINFKKGPLYLTAEEEEGKRIAQANISIDKDGKILRDRILVRLDGDNKIIDNKLVDYIDIAPNQIASISASLIPFLEHDDANRALMGSNMMRQAVPLLKPETPIVGTGLEEKLVKDSKVIINAAADGVIESVDSKTIVVKYNLTEEDRLLSFEPELKKYKLTKFMKTNQGSIINLNPIVKKGDKIKKGQVLCEGYATRNGELALGRNLKVAFMPWKGYNFEDAIVISERIVKEDVFTSIHIEEYSLEVRDTKLGKEELTSDIPNISEEITKNLDENGIIRVGCEVKPGDILIGKITPKGESDPTPEEKLLRAIFGDKAGDVKDASLKASPSLNGIVIDTKLFSRVIKDKRTKDKETQALSDLEAQFSHEANELRSKLVDKLTVLLNGKVCKSVKNDLGEDIFPKGKKFSKKMFEDVLDYTHTLHGEWTNDEALNDKVNVVLHHYIITNQEIEGKFKREKFAISVGDELPAGILKLAKVYVAKKRKLKVGDKMAGRHGNKGIVAKIVKEEDMPFLEDGTPVDVVLNPLGVPSRMNIGQIFETVLGWIGETLGEKYATPVFDGATTSQIDELTKKAKLPEFGNAYLYDGGTGERFDQRATVGVIYMLKLGHMVDDKMHARSTGPYSLITQQPLGGKAQFGGQRFGEMEVWALEAYGASSILREVLTIKSDDIVGRAKAYEAIVKGDSLPTKGLPESFKVLMHELRGLALDVRLEGEN